jgi:hypothetical protein
MSDLPELPLFEEIEDISTSPNFFTYTQDEFNKTWSYYESEATTSQSANKSLWDTPTSGGQSPVTNTSAKASPTRDAWDPMLWNMTLTKYVEISQETEVVGRLPELETPISHLTCLANMYLEQSLNPVSSPSSPSSCSSPKHDISAIGHISATEVPLSLEVQATVTGSNQLPLSPTFRARKTTGSPGQLSTAARQQKSVRRKLFSKEGQLVTGISQLRGLQKVNQSDTKQTLKKKLYEMGPFSDPSKERERKNALNAKKNRDQKKGLLSSAKQEILNLKSSNSRLVRTANMEKKKLLAAQREIKLLKLQLKSLHNTVE